MPHAKIQASAKDTPLFPLTPAQLRALLARLRENEKRRDPGKGHAVVRSA